MPKSVKIEQVKLGVSELTGEVYIGTLCKKGVSWATKYPINNMFISAVLKKFLGDKEISRTTAITTGKEKWLITIKKVEE